MNSSDIIDYFINTNEFKPIGEGACATTFEIPHSKTKVLKIFPMNRPNYDFIKLIENSDLSCFPKIYRIEQIKNIGISIMERLEHIGREITNILDNNKFY